MTAQLSEELQYSQALVQPLLACLQALSKQVAEAGAAPGGGDPARLRLLLSNVRLVASIFYSLNSPGLTDVSARVHGRWGGGSRWGRSRWGRVAAAAERVWSCIPRRIPVPCTQRCRSPLLRVLRCALRVQAFEETLDAWMAEWHTYLTFDAPASLAEADPEKESVVDGVKAQVCGLGLLWVRGARGRLSLRGLRPACVGRWLSAHPLPPAPGTSAATLRSHAPPCTHGPWPRRCASA